ncbi:hypothetical protein LMJ76_15055, partial [Escherichia coli]|nr:hypothetical protein [Escherichia coli]
SLKTSIKTITYLSDTGCLEIQGASLHPKYQDIIYGAHYHVYYEEAGYYSDRIAFPIEDDINPDDLVGYWNYFCKHLNITYSGRIPLPLEDESGQMGFGI